MRKGANGRAKRARESEVRQLELAVPANEEVLRLQVAVTTRMKQTQHTEGQRERGRS